MTGQDKTAVDSTQAPCVTLTTSKCVKLATQPSPPPFSRPHVTVGEIRDAIPKHCFERSVLRSFGHLATDLMCVTAMGYLDVYLMHVNMSLWLSALVWPAYWYIQGCFMTGIWVLAHECGHQAFTPHKWLNNAVGLVLHSALLVPYHSWRISHGNHHKNTCSMENDEVFVPPTRSEYNGAEILEESPLWNLFGVVKMLLFGWPLYLIANVAGPAKYRGKRNSHFNPNSALFKQSQRGLVSLSDVGMVAAFAAIGWAWSVFGFKTLAAMYLLPYLVVNMNLVLITYLQHTAPYIPHYRSDEFDWLRGALSTVDRSFGPVLNHVFHHITDTHVAHHLFHTMPFYHAEEATEAIKTVLGPYYLKDDTPIFQSLMLSWRQCRCVEDTGSILHFKSE